MDNKIIARVCKHAYLAFSKFDSTSDLLTAKITRIYENGKRESVLIQKKNYRRTFYTVKPKYRTFNDRRDYIEISKCDKHTSNEARLADNISKVLWGRPNPKANLAELKNSQFLFGCHETVPVVFKQKFFEKYPNHQPEEAYVVAAYDVETYINPDGEAGDVNMASLTCEDVVHFVGVRSFFPDKDDETIIRKLNEHADLFLSDYMKRHNVTIHWHLVDTPGQCVYLAVQAFHIVGPDWIVSWNANFDMSKNEEMLTKEGYDLKQVYSDPSIPDEFKDYNYYEGRKFKTKVDGSQTPLDPQERFPTLRAPAKWQWFDGMSFYAIKRAPGGKLESYSLQSTAEREGIEGKLYTEHGSHLELGSGEWHIYMQKHHPYIYAMYNIRDNWTIEDLNRETNDYSLSLPSLIGPSELGSYQSQPSMISDKLSFIAMEHGYVWGTVGRKKDDPLKELKPDLRDWIALLHAELNELNGIPLFRGLQDWRSMGRGDTDDIDVTGAYPHVTVSLNVSNRTTQLEVCKVEGLDRMEFRRLGVNYASSPVANASTLCNTVYNMPNLTEVCNFYVNEVVPFVEGSEVKEAA